MGLREEIVSQNDVALGISKHVLLTEGNISDSVVSPLSIQLVLGLIAVGSKGPTSISCFLSSSPSPMTTHLFLLRTRFVVFADGSANGGPLFSFANGVWVDKSLSLKPSFKEILEDLYRAGCNEVDFQTKAVEVTNEVNAWAEKETNGLIKEVLPSGNKNQFIRAFDVFKVLRLPYEQGEDERRFFTYFFLPDAKDGLPALVEKVGSESGFLDHHLPQQKWKWVSSGFLEPICFKHIPKSFIEVNEEGTEAATSTVANITIASAVPSADKLDFVADHPFLFLINEETTASVLFVGQVLDPSQAD
ncbi:hypothetical protein GH714_005588 [Hevea brasiliensis]|uniref:Serpin domain-containing protein n=1 Tax=Hevea brasiliensis TaxID=3981 RepID=A0A6A6MBX2_HEVBR|nr:hypothetical protein GH714_005588 [Hevea brasiliensis]